MAPRFVREQLISKKSQLEAFIRAVVVESCWEEMQVLGLLFVSMLWGPRTISKAREIASSYEAMFNEGLKRNLIMLLKTTGFSFSMGKWLVDSMQRLNVSHGHLLQHFRGANCDAEPAYFELAFVGRAEEDIEQFLRLAKKIRSG